MAPAALLPRPRAHFSCAPSFHRNTRESYACNSVYAFTTNLSIIDPRSLDSSHTHTHTHDKFISDIATRDIRSAHPERTIRSPDRLHR